MNEHTLKLAFDSIVQRPTRKRSDNEIELKVMRLMDRMTLTEKIGQMYQGTHFSAELVGPAMDTSDIVNLIKEGRVGSILSVSNPLIIYRLQKYAVEESRLGIPLLFAYDVIHGYKTIFPINLALACSWNESLIEATSRIAARECAYGGVHMTFAPMLDLVKDARWGRVMESFGEDPYLGTRVAKAYVEGFQGQDLSERSSVAACAKHFLGYGMAEAGREYNFIDASEGHLRRNYLPPFISAVNAGVASIMTAFNVVDGIPATGNEKYLRDLLKGELGFNGMVISDFNSSGEMIRHRTARDIKDVCRQSLKAGLDMEMGFKGYITELESLVNESPELMVHVDDSVRRVLMLKYRLGLFDDPYKGLGNKTEDYLLKEDARALAREAACESVVLLENDGILPVLDDIKIALMGPLSESNEVNGFWRAIGEAKDTVSFKDGLEAKGLEILSAPCMSFDEPNQVDLEKAVSVAKEADLIIMAIGEHEDMSGEGASRVYLNLPGKQRELFDAVKAVGKPIVTVIFSGRPLELGYYKENSAALIQGWYLGSESGNALADIIVGDFNPCGRLTMSFPHSVGQVPIYYNQLPTGRNPLDGYDVLRFSSRYIDAPNTPLYPFGFGLSYTSFEYRILNEPELVLERGQTLAISVEVENTGERFGTDVVQLYLSTDYCTVSRPSIELKDFERVTLCPGEKQKVVFEISEETLSYIGKDLVKEALEGDYRIHIGKHSGDLMEPVIISLI